MVAENTLCVLWLDCAFQNTIMNTTRSMRLVEAEVGHNSKIGVNGSVMCVGDGKCAHYLEFLRGLPYVSPLG